MKDEEYMKIAIDLAKKGYGFTNPNPMVGAVIVSDDKIIGQGYHEKYGGPHAEINAISSCKIPPRNATLYVTLEPCCHYGKTPPCTDAIIKSGISKVVIGSKDPNPSVSGKGVQALKNYGITVFENFLKQDCDNLNTVFFHYIKTGLPFVTMKYAMTMDGKIATSTGASRWITGKSAREHVHKNRLGNSAIMVGLGTVITDDPMLTCRLENGKNPLRILCDTKLGTPLTSKVVTTAQDVPTLIATSCSDVKKHSPYLKANCRILVVTQVENHLNLKELMIKLGEEKIDSILLEGGSTLNWSALESGIVNKVQTYIAPKLLGGKDAKSPIEGLGVLFPDNAFLLKNSSISKIGSDILIESEVVKNVYRHN